MANAVMLYGIDHSVHMIIGGALAIQANRVLYSYS